MVVKGLRPIDRSCKLGMLRKASVGTLEKLLSSSLRRLRVTKPRNDVPSNFLRRHDERSKNVRDRRLEKESGAIVFVNGFPDRYNSAKFDKSLNESEGTDCSQLSSRCRILIAFNPLKAFGWIFEILFLAKSTFCRFLECSNTFGGSSVTSFPLKETNSI